MVDLTNLLTQIATFGNVSTPQSPFKANEAELNFVGYQGLNNDNDKYVIDAQREKMQKLVEKAKNDIKAGTGKEEIASTLYKELLGLEGTDGQKYDITSKEFLQNFNALVSQVKDDPSLVNALRKSLVTNFGTLTDQQRNLDSNAKKEWNEIIYENSLDKLKTQNTTISSELESLSKLDPTKAEDKKKIDSFITNIKKDFGDVAKFNELLKDANIKYKIDGSEEKGYSIKSSDPNHKASATDPKSTKAIQKDTLDTWEENAEFIKSLDTSKFKTVAGKKEAQAKIKELAKGDKTYTEQELKENLDFLTKAYKHSLDTGEFSMAELDRARMNLIGKAHEAEKPAIEDYRDKYKGATNKPPYKSEFSDEISKLNTIAFLQSKSLRENEIIPRLENAAKANDFKDIKAATGGEDSALAELIEKSRNWKPKEPEAAEKISAIKADQLKSASYNPTEQSISFSGIGNNSTTANIGLDSFIDGLTKNEIKLKDSQGNIIKIEDAKNKVTLKKDDESKEIKVEINNGSEQKIVFGIPLNELTDEFVKNYTTYATVDQLLQSLNAKKK
jgi:hypothetical protein